MSPGVRPVRIGVVGAGSFGSMHVRTLLGLPEAELVAVVDSNPSALEALRRDRLDLPVFTELEPALARGTAEAWVVASSTRTHVEIAQRLLAASQTVLVEKPLAADRASAETLRPLVAADSRNLMLGHLLLFAPEFRKLLEQARTRGPIVHFHAVRHRSTEHVNLYPGETPLELTMVHDLYLALALMQGREPTTVRGRLMPRPGGGCDLVLAELEWGNETWGSFTASFLTPPALGLNGFDRFEVHGRDWGARMTLNPQPLEVWAERTEWPLALDIFDDPSAPAGWLAEELRAFCRVVRGTASVPVGARYEDALRVLDWIERVRQSAHAH